MYGNFDILLGPVLNHFSDLSLPPHTGDVPGSVICFVPVLIGCWSVLAIPCFDQFISSGVALLTGPKKYCTALDKAETTVRSQLRHRVGAVLAIVAALCHPAYVA